MVGSVNVDTNIVYDTKLEESTERRASSRPSKIGVYKEVLKHKLNLPLSNDTTIHSRPARPHSNT